TFEDATAFGDTHSGNGHPVAANPSGHTNGHRSASRADLTTEVRSLRETLTEINVALKLARELPADADVGPLVEAIRTRVGAALDQSARLDAMVDHERALGRESKKSAN